MPRNELDCYFNGCTGTLAYCGDDPNDSALYRCRECGDEYPQEEIEYWAEKDGEISKLANVLLEGYYEEN